jgi:hypothetical protein
MNDRTKRRNFLKLGLAAAGVAVLPRAMRADELKHLAESYPPAQALGYRDDATSVDRTKYPRFAPGQMCANCKLFQGKADTEYGPCQLYPGQAVRSKGWCSGYTPKSG